MTPDGNSYNALHTDLLETEKEILDKAKYQSIIPVHGYLSRFTAPVSSIKYYSYKSFYQYTTRLGNTTLTISDKTLYKYYIAGNYYPVRDELWYGRKDRKYLMSHLTKLSQYILNNRQSGIGFRILLDEVSYDYTFLFEVSSIIARNNKHAVCTDETLLNWYMIESDGRKTLLQP